MKQTTIDGNELFLVAVNDSAYGYGHVNFAFGTIRDNKVYLASYDEFDNLQVTCQFNVNEMNVDEQKPESLYAWNVEYRNQYGLNAAKINQMAKTLNRIDKGLTKLQAEWGYASDYANYVMRVAKVLGVSRVVITENSRKGWRLNPDEYQIWSVTELPFLVRGQVRQIVNGK